MENYFEPISFATCPNDKAGFADRLGRAFEETGFAVITDHGLDQALIERAVACTKAFFGLPEAVKRQYHAETNSGRRGYTPFGTENAKGQTVADLKEFWHTGRAAPAGSAYAESMTPTPRVAEITGFDEATHGLFDALDTMGHSILCAIALHLGLEEDWFTPRVREGNSILRLLHYPAQATPPPPGSVRAAAHEDINVITLLLGAEEAGLEVKHKTAGWLAVNPPAGALVINVGDMLQRLTNGKLPSTTHRVVNPSSERSAHPRYSTPFFLHFAPEVMITPMESCIQEGDSVMPAISAHDYLMERLREIGLLKT